MSHTKPLTVGGIGATPSLDDVVSVARGHQIALDTAGSERIKKESPPPKSFDPEPAAAADASQQSAAAVTESNGAAAAGPSWPAHLSHKQARAVLFTRLLSLMNGKSGVRLQLADFLKELLNRDIIPALPANDDAGALSAVANACKAEGSSNSTTGSAHKALAAALEAAGLSTPGISAGERAALTSGASAAAGVGSLMIVSGRQLLTAVTAVSALSCEAAGAQTKAFEADVVEAQGYKGAIGAADELRGLLEGSKAAGSRKGLSAQQQAAFSSLPQVLGAAADALGGAYNAVRPEVQSAALPVKAGTIVSAASPTLAPALLDAAHALLSLAHSCLYRAQTIAAAGPCSQSPTAAQLQALTATAAAGPLAAAQQQLADVGTQLFLNPGQQQQQGSGEQQQQQQGLELKAALAAEAALQALQRAAAVEGVAAVVSLRLQEGPAAPEAAPDAAAAAPPSSQDDSSSGGSGKKKEKKKDKKGGAGGLVLGKGTGIVRSHLEKAMAAAGPAAVAAVGTLGVVPAAAAGGEGQQPQQQQLEAAAVLLEGPAGVDAVQGVVTSHEAAAVKMLEDVQVVVEANQARRKPKVAKGARDFLPDQMAIREAAFNVITSVFKRHGAVAIDTPVFELRETLMGKYGEDSKLIYDLADQGGELLSLRYDLTVPFARYVAVNAIGNIKRYHIGKVYRRDQPQLNRGRFREFFQCDFDIAGSYAAMVPDAEVLKVLVEILTDLQLGKFTVKLNHRRLLDAMLAIAGVPAQKFRPICSAIDKLDKEPWDVVRAEMVEEKGLPGDVADTIGQFVVLKDEPRRLLSVLTESSHPLAQHADSAAALQELGLLFDYLEAFGALGPISFDLSLARGLDYYTGVIYEAVLEGGNVGSIAAGGRYDKLVGMFSGKDVPAVGVSIGIERVFAIAEAQARARAAESGTAIRATETQVLVASIGNGMQIKRMELANKLWAAGIKAEFGFKPNPKMGDQLGYALEQGIPFMVLFGDDELKQGVVKVKDMAAKTEETVAVDSLVDTLKQLLAAAPQPAAAAAAAGDGAAAAAGAVAAAAGASEASS